jgi:dUTPase
LIGLTTIVIKAEEAAKLYIMRKSQDHVIDYEVPPKDWLHPTDSPRTTEHKDEHAIQIFTERSKSEHVVGAGITIFIPSKLARQLRYTLHSRCSNNQVEQLAIVKALATIEKTYQL